MKLSNKMLFTGLAVLASAEAFADARVTVAHFAPFADTLDGTSVSVDGAAASTTYAGIRVTPSVHCQP